MSLGNILANTEHHNHVQRIIPIASPAAGNEWSITVPGGSIWSPIGITYRLVCSAAAANRVSTVAFTDGSTTFGQCSPSVLQVATQSFRYSLWRGLGQGSVSAGASIQVASLPELWLPSGFTIASLTSAIDVADQYSAVALIVEEILVQPPGVKQHRDFLNQFMLALTSAENEGWYAP